MPENDHSSNNRFPHQLFHGTTWHSRLLPSVHKFTYPYRYWGVNITALVAGKELPEVMGSINSNELLDKLRLKIANVNKLLSKALPLFSAEHKALQQFYADDYLQDLQLQGVESQSSETATLNNNFGSDDTSIDKLLQRLNFIFQQKTSSVPTGDIIGLVVCRNVGLYFSPVNFYIGFNKQQNPTHLLAEVSNTPWDKRHYYGFLLEGEQTDFCHDKNFHVSPFNPIDQLYRWQVSVKPANVSSKKSQDSATNADETFNVRIAINISDERGEVLKTGVKMTGEPMTKSAIRQTLKQNPLMNMTSLTRIYWHAFKLYAIKKVPYISYDQKLADSKQGKDHE